MRRRGGGRPRTQVSTVSGDIRIVRGPAGSAMRPSRPTPRRTPFRTSTPPSRQAVHARPVRQRSLPGRHVRGIAAPCLERRGLQRAPVRERQLPRVRPDPVHLVQVDGRILVRLTAGQEDDAGDVRGTFALRTADGRLRDLDRSRLRRAALRRDHHVHLEERAGEVDPRVGELRVERAEGPAGRVLARLDRVRAVHQDLRLDDRHDVGLLTERRVARHRVGVRVQA